MTGATQSTTYEQKPSKTVAEMATIISRSEAGVADAKSRLMHDSKGNVITEFVYSFGYNATDPAISNFTGPQQEQAKLAMKAWESVGKITFRQAIGDEAPTIYFVNDHFEQDGVPDEIEGGRTTLVGTTPGSMYKLIQINLNKPVNQDMSAGTEGFKTLMHEVGHAIGLDHTGYYNGRENVSGYEEYASYKEDTLQYSTMSYFAANKSLADFGEFFPSGPMIADIAAIQILYGNKTVNAGNTVYGYNALPVIGERFSVKPEGAVFSIQDTDGDDTLDGSGSTAAQVIDLRAGHFSNMFGLTKNVSIALGVAIETAKAGSGGDTLIANDAGNLLYGGSGNDTIRGGAGDDVIVGSVGEDSVYGSGGADLLSFALSSSALHLGSGRITSDMSRTSAWKQAEGTSYIGIEKIVASQGADLIEVEKDLPGIVLAAGGDDTFLVRYAPGSSSFHIDGGDGNDTLDFSAFLEGVSDNHLATIDLKQSKAYFDSGMTIDFESVESFHFGSLGTVIIGTDANDSLKTGTGNSAVYGGLGNDVLVADVAVAGTGRNSIYGEDGNDILSALDGAFISGGVGNDIITGSASADVIEGGYARTVIVNGVPTVESDNDIIHAGVGDDIVLGLSGQDLVDGGTGTDELQLSGYNASFSYSLSGGSLVVSKGVDAALLTNMEFIRIHDPSVSDDIMISVVDILASLGKRSGGPLNGSEILDAIQQDALPPVNAHHLIGTSGSDAFHLKDGDVVKGNGGVDTYYVDTSLGGKFAIADFKADDTLIVNGQRYTGRFRSDVINEISSPDIPSEFDQYGNLVSQGSYHNTTFIASGQIYSGFSLYSYQNRLIGSGSSSTPNVADFRPNGSYNYAAPTFAQIGDNSESFSFDSSANVGMLSLNDGGVLTDIVFGEMKATGLSFDGIRAQFPIPVYYNDLSWIVLTSPYYDMPSNGSASGMLSGLDVPSFFPVM